MPSKNTRRTATGNTLVTKNQNPKASRAPKAMSTTSPRFFDPVMEATAETRVARMDPELKELSTPASTPLVRVRMGLPSWAWAISSSSICWATSLPAWVSSWAMAWSTSPQATRSTEVFTR